jgi:hypothetical protein
MNANFTHISVCLDRSFSMKQIKPATISGYNEFLNGQKSAPGRCTLTLVQFDSQGIDTLYNAVPISLVCPLDDNSFQPRANTPLYDAIAHTITETGKALKSIHELDRPAKVVCVIITDGEENASQRFTREAVFDAIKHQRDVYKWEFVFIGANQDAMAVGMRMGVSPANCMTSTANDVGTHALYASVSSNLRRYRSGGCRTMSFSSDQQAEQDRAAGKV